MRVRSPLRHLTAAALLGALCAAPGASAATFLVLDSEDGDAVGAGRHRLLSSADGAFTATRYATGVVDVTVNGGSTRGYWTLDFAPPAGGVLLPGTYEGARGPLEVAGAPGLEVSRGAFRCESIRGRFVVHEAVYGAGDAVLSFVADFEQHCNGAGPALFGSVRYRAGDPTCAGASDGTPCEDHSACTMLATCVSGVCAGLEPTLCPAAGQCEEGGFCNPTTGTCFPPQPKPFGTPCSDGDACTPFDDCEQGRCVSGIRDGCYDGDDCTDDACSVSAGCLHRPIPGACGAPGIASTLLFVDATPTTYSPGTQRMFTPAEGSFSLRQGFDGSVEVSFYGRSVNASWTVGFSPAQGQRLAPGSYPDLVIGGTSNPAVPSLYVSEGAPCEAGSASFVVHEVRYGSDGTATSIAADFQYTCTQNGFRVTGAVRYGTGDATCDGAPDGAPCEPLNACLGAASCEAGRCVGQDSRSCPPSDACHQPAACDPRSGTCVAPLAHPDDLACDDGSVCTERDACRAGACVGEPIDCDDGNVCTRDACAATTGCLHEPLAGTCWALRGPVTVSATAFGKTCSCTYRSGGDLLALRDDGTFSTPGGTAVCPGSSVTFPEETGSIVAGRRGRLELETANLDAIKEALAQCAGGAVRVTRYGGWVKRSDDGQRVRGARIARVRVKGSPVTTGSVLRFSGSPTTGSHAPSNPAGAQRCTRALRSCLQEAAAAR